MQPGWSFRPSTSTNDSSITYSLSIRSGSTLKGANLAASAAKIIKVLLAVGLILMDAEFAVLKRLLTVRAYEALIVPLLRERGHVTALARLRSGYH